MFDNRKCDGHLFRTALVDCATSTPDEIAKVHGHLIGSVVGAGWLARARARSSRRALVSGVCVRVSLRGSKTSSDLLGPFLVVG